MGDGAAGALCIARPAAGPPPGRPEPVEQHRPAEANKPKLRRARFFATHAPRDQAIPPEMPERKHAGAPDVFLARPLAVPSDPVATGRPRSEEHTPHPQSHLNVVCRLLLEKKKT